MTRTSDTPVGRVRARRRHAPLVATIGLCLAIPVIAQVGGGYDLSWNTMDGGGATFSVGGGFSLGGAIAQPDAGATMTGGGFRLIGGFWPAAMARCDCPADLTNNGTRDGEDVPGFVACLLGAGTTCACADLDANGLLTSADVTMFVNLLLAGQACP